MRLTMKDKLKMCEEHIKNGKSLSHVSEMYGGYYVSNIKYLVNLYRKHGKNIFYRDGETIYRKDTKLLAIGRVKSGESIRSVALDLGLIDPTILGDWVKLFKEKGKEGIKDTYSRKRYLLEDERIAKMVNKETLEENIKLKAEIEYLKKSQSLTRKLEVVTRKEKTKIVTELRTMFPLKILLEIAEMNSSVYYYNVNAMKEKINKYVEVEKQIDYLYLKKHKKRLGYQRIYIELKRESIKIGKNKVLEIMREKGYLKRKRKKWRKYNSYEGEIGKVYPNVLDRNFKTEKPYQKAGTDITMFPIKGESVYLSPIIDFNSREVLSYSVGRNAKIDKITYMLNSLRRKHKDMIKGMIIQSDQGVQYQNSRYNQKLKELGIVQSMSRKGNCLDNSPTENFFGRMKEEIWNGQEEKYLDSNHLIKTIHEYIKYYNETRIVMKLKMSPLEYRNSLNNIIE